jgi:phosphinothricin acetyltransferase
LAFRQCRLIGGVHAEPAYDRTHPNVGLKIGRWLDTVRMQRSLGEGATTVPADSKV